MKKLLPILIICFVLLSWVLLAPNGNAVPTFARKYKTSCSTCHYAFGRLNKFGRAFRNNGLRYPGDDKDFAKQETVSLGSESYKKVFPDAIWPADLSGIPPISFRWISRTTWIPNNTDGSDTPNGVTFQNPHELEAFMVGTVGEDISYWFELGWEHVEEFDYGGWLDYKFSDQFHARLGNIEYMPIHGHERLTVAHYNFGSYADINGSGLEFWGAVNGAQDKGGLYYSAAVVNGQNDGEENIDLNADKDLVFKASYKIGGMGVLGSTQASETSAFWKDNSATLGGFGHTGTNDDGSQARDFGGNADLFYENLNVFGMFMVSQYRDADTAEWVDTKRAFAEADYVLYPWLIPVARFQYTKPDNSDAEKQLVPAVVIMARANVKIVPTALIDLNGNKYNHKVDLQVEVGF